MASSSRSQLRKDFDHKQSSNQAVSIRKASSADIPHIQRLHNAETDFHFGSNNRIEELIETRMSPTVIISAINSIVGFICFDLKPNWPALDASVWLDWIHHHFEISECDYNNTLFIDYLVFERPADPEILRIVLNEVFLNYESVNLVMAVEPPTCSQNSYQEMFMCWSSPRASKIVPSQFPHSKLYVFEKQWFLPSLKFRIATAEDNDTLVNMLDKKYPSLKRKKGEYHVAEWILSEDPNKTYLVMEQNDEIYGTTLINFQVNLDFLNKHFDLSLLGFLKVEEADQTAAQTLLVEDVILRKRNNFVTPNYFNLTPKEFQRVHIPAKTDDQEEDGEDNVSVASLDEYLLSMSFDFGEPEASTLADLTSKHPNFFGMERNRLIDDNPNFIYREKQIKIPGGRSNAFIIEKFASDLDLIDDRRMYELLQNSFALCTDREYCIMLVKPMHSSQPMLRYFTYIPPRAQSDCKFSLYVVHRNTLMHQIEVSEATQKDISDIEKFLKIYKNDRSSEAETILSHIVESITSYYHYYQCIVIRTVSSIIGLAVLCPENRLHSLRKYFHIDEYVSFSVAQNPLLHGRIKYLLLQPIFSNAYRMIFMQISRNTGYKYFYYSIENRQNVKIYNNLLAQMHSVMPTVVYNILDKSCVKHRTAPFDPDVFRTEHSDPLYFQSMHSCEQQFTSIDARIVCYGFDDVCKAFLKKIIFDPKYRYYRFQNITVLTQPGEFECETTDVYDRVLKLLNFETYFGPSFMRRLGLRAWVTFHGGNLGAIDRATKTIYLHDHTKLQYDYLLLTCNIQYGYPSNAVWKHSFRPSNYEAISNAMQAALFVRKLQILKGVFRRGFRIIVYGNTMHSYACINFLLETCVPARFIHFVISKELQEDKLNVGAFRDEYVEQLILGQITALGVHIYQDYRFIRWDFHENSHMISSVTFGSKLRAITLKCRLFICFNARNLSRRSKNIFQRCGLLIDHRLVIDEDFRMNDSYVFAAGPMTQYKRALYASKFDHYYYNRFEVGESLADKFCQIALRLPKSQHSTRIQNFHRPGSQQAFLPGGYRFIQVTKSGPLLPENMSKLFEQSTGKNMVWKAAEHIRNEELGCSIASGAQSEYFRIQFLQNGTCRLITCLTKRLDIPLDFLIRIFDCNEKLLNSFVKKWDAGQIRDPLEFFTQSWIAALIFPRFNAMRKENRKLMLNALLEDSKTSALLKEYLRAKENVYLFPNERKSIWNSLSNVDTVRAIELNLLRFINENHHYLFMYKKCPIDLPHPPESTEGGSLENK